MKDAYSFDLDAAGLDRSFAEMRAAYERIYARCDLRAFGAEAFSGAMGGRESIEFLVSTSVGEDTLVHCSGCGYAANLEIARSRLPQPVDDASVGLEPFATPGVLTIDALAAAPYSIPPQRQLKTLVYLADSQPVVAVVRGDDTLNEAKLQLETGASLVQAADPQMIAALMRAHPGSLGAVAFDRAPVLVDDTLVGRTNMVTGANRDGFHLRGVDVARDVLSGSHARAADLRTVREGEVCANCDGRLETFAALEVGHIFKQGTRYTARMGATILDANGADVPLVMGAYGIGLGRLMAAVVEAHHDDDGILWPRALAPFDAVVLTLGPEAELLALADAACSALQAAGLEVLYDDRDERAGVKFKDADLIGVPLRIGVGRRGVASNGVEWKERASQQVELVSLAELADRAAQIRSARLALEGFIPPGRDYVLPKGSPS